jgi:hypothetical protein
MGFWNLMDNRFLSESIFMDCSFPLKYLCYSILLVFSFFLIGCGGGGGTGGSDAPPAAAVETKSLQLKAFDTEPLRAHYQLQKSKEIPIETNNIQEPVDFSLVTREEGIRIEKRSDQIIWEPPQNKNETVQVTLKAEAEGIVDKRTYEFESIAIDKIDQKPVPRTGSHTVTFSSSTDTQLDGAQLVIPEDVDRSTTGTVEIYKIPEESQDGTLFPDIVLNSNISLIGDTSTGFFLDIPVSNFDLSENSADSDNIFLTTREDLDQISGRRTSNAPSQTTISQPTWVEKGRIRTELNSAMSSIGAARLSYERAECDKALHSEHFSISTGSGFACDELSFSLSELQKVLENSYDKLNTNFNFPSPNASKKQRRDTISVVVKQMELAGNVSPGKPEIININFKLSPEQMRSTATHELVHVGQMFSLGGVKPFVTNTGKIGYSMRNMFFFEGVAEYYAFKMTTDKPGDSRIPGSIYTEYPLWGHSGISNSLRTDETIVGPSLNAYTSHTYFNYLDNQFGVSPSKSNLFAPADPGSLTPRDQYFVFRRMDSVLQNRAFSTISKFIHSFSREFNFRQRPSRISHIDEWSLKKPAQLQDPLTNHKITFDNHSTVLGENEPRTTLTNGHIPVYASKIFKLSFKDTSVNSRLALSYRPKDSPRNESSPFKLRISIYEKGDFTSPITTFSMNSGRRELPDVSSDAIHLVATLFKDPPNNSEYNGDFFYQNMRLELLKSSKKPPVITTPTPKEQFDTDRVKLKGNLGDTPVEKVVAENYGETVVLSKSNQSGTFAGEISIKPGTHTIYVSTFDTAGISSDSVTINYDIRPLELGEGFFNPRSKKVADTAHQVSMMQLSVESTVGSSDSSVIATRLSFNTTGSDSEHTHFVEQAYLYRDSNNNGSLEDGIDTFLAEGTFNDSTLEFDVFEEIEPGKKQHWIVTYNFNGNPDSGDQFGLKVTRKNDLQANYRLNYFRPEVPFSPLKGASVKISSTDDSELESSSEKGWPQFGFDQNNSGYKRGQGAINNLKTSDVSMSSGDGIVTSAPSTGDIDGDGFLEIVYGTQSGTVTALHADGTKEWAFETGNTVHVSPALIDIDQDQNKEVIIASDDGYVYALDGAKEEWSFFTNGFMRSSPVTGDIDGDDSPEIVIGANATDHKIYALEKNGSKKWSFTVGGSILSDQALGDIDDDGNSEILVTSEDGLLYAIDSDGTKLWDFRIGSGASTSPGDGKFISQESAPTLKDLNGDNTPEIVVGADLEGSVFEPQGAIAVLDASGNEIDSFGTSSSVRSSPSIADIDDDDTLEIVFGTEGNVVYVMTLDGVFLNRQNKISDAGNLPILGDINGDDFSEIITVSTGKDEMIGYDKNGNELWGIVAFPTDAEYTTSPILSDLDDDDALEITVGLNGAVYTYDK